MSSFISIIPSVLIAVASVLVDASFRPEQCHERIGAQILLWLAASLENTTASSRVVETPLVLVNVVFFCSLTSAACMAWSIRRRWSSRQQQRCDYLRLLAPSSLVTLLYSFTHLGDDASHNAIGKKCAALFASSFGVLCLWKWYYRLQKKIVRRNFVGIPVVQSEAAQHGSSTLDESTWYQWTPNQVLTWISTLGGDNSDSVRWDEVCGLLAPECIPGSVLGYLKVSDLRSMAVPYGPAFQLVEHVHKLASRYPAPQRDARDNYNEPQYHYENDMLHPNTWLAQDGEWVQPDQFLLKSKPPTSFMDEPDQIDNSMAQRAQELMKERFGLELPVLRTNVQPQGSGNGIPKADHTTTFGTVEPTRHHIHQKIGSPEPAQQLSVLEDSADNETSLEGIPPALLAAMPPHIRDIAARKPHLVRQLLASRGTPAEEKENSNDATPSLSRVQELRMQADPSYASRFVGAQAAAELASMPVASNATGTLKDDQDYEDSSSDNDGEHKLLLRRRATNSP